MKEVTRIVTVEITEIVNVDDDLQPFDKCGFEKELKESLDVDDVQVIKAQDFIIDKEDCNE